MNNVKIFVTYHKKAPVFRNAIFEPIQTGCDDAVIDLNFLKDNIGNNISYKNKNYGELSAWYWVWKNYLPQHPELEYVGFCHYRRFMNFKKVIGKHPFRPILINNFEKNFSKLYNPKKVSKLILSNDIILTQKESFNVNIYEQYEGHPRKDLDILIKIFSKKYPKDIKLMEEFFNSFMMHICLNFVMKRDLFEDLCCWMFDLLEELEKQSDWSTYQDYTSIRTPAYLAERFFNIWVEKKKGTYTVKEVDSYLLCSENEIIKKTSKQILKDIRRKIFRFNIKKNNFYFLGIDLKKCYMFIKNKCS